MKRLLAAALSLSLHAPACATSLEGLKSHLQQNKDKYNDFAKEKKPFLSTVGAVKLHEDVDVGRDIQALSQGDSDGPPNGAEESDKASLYGKPGASVAPGSLAGLKTAGEAAGLGGTITGSPEAVNEESVLAFDHETGERVEKTEEDMYKEIIEAIVKDRCKTEAAAGAFRALLWGAVVLEVMQRRENPWPAMVDETRSIWEGHVAAIALARKQYLESGKVEGAAGHMPIIIYKPQSEVGATATWQGGVVTVGDQFASLSGPAKIAVLFHEDEHHWDDQTTGIHDNYWSHRLQEPDDTPSGKNFTETLAYRQMGDWIDVLNLPWPKLDAKVKDKVPAAL